MLYKKIHCGQTELVFLILVLFGIVLRRDWPARNYISQTALRGASEFPPMTFEWNTVTPVLLFIWTWIGFSIFFFSFHKINVDYNKILGNSGATRQKEFRYVSHQMNSHLSPRNTSEDLCHAPECMQWDCCLSYCERQTWHLQSLTPGGRAWMSGALAAPCCFYWDNRRKRCAPGATVQCAGRNGQMA